MSRMHNPPHPGLILKLDVLPALKMTVTDAAKHLHVSRVALSRVINGKAAISADLAVRLADWMNPSAQSWLAMQAAYDLWQAEHKKRRPKIRKLEERASA